MRDNGRGEMVERREVGPAGSLAVPAWFEYSGGAAQQLDADSGSAGKPVPEAFGRGYQFQKGRGGQTAINKPAPVSGSLTEAFSVSVHCFPTELIESMSIKGPPWPAT